MPFTRAGQLARSVPTARVDDPLPLIAENLRTAPHGVLPVLDRPTFGEGDASEREARIVGLIDARDLSKIALPTPVLNGANGAPADFWSQNLSLNGHAPSSLKNGVARDVMRSDVGFVPAIFTLENALLTLNRYDASALPVLDEAGRYRGVISRADVLSALAGGVRPAVLGGMATPLGVWLTDGTRSGGAPPLGLFLSGAILGALIIFSQLILAGLAGLVSRDWMIMALSGRLGMMMDTTGGLFNLAAVAIQGTLFLLMFRFLPISGVHAAEHQTVWAVERGLPLEPEFVEQMPRAHPRCGTNLMVLSGLIVTTMLHLPDFSSLYIVAVLVGAFFFWRSLGTVVQEVFTTRPASRKQIEGGIRAAKEVIEKYNNEPAVSAPSPLRLLNGGIFWSAAGSLSALAVMEWGVTALARWILGA